VLKFARGKTIFGIFILIYVFSFGICSFEFHGVDGHSWDDYFPALHWAGDPGNFVPSGDLSSWFIIMTSSLIRFSHIREATLPPLSFSIFRPPEIARIFLRV
jgi:hypothetical protein